MDEKLDRLLRRHEELAAQMSGRDIGDTQVFVRASKEYADLTPVVEAIQALRAAEREAEGLQELAGAEDGDAEMRALAQEELPTVVAAIAGHEHRLKVLLLPRDAADEKTQSWKSGPAPEETRRRSSRPICSACISAIRSSTAGVSP